MAGNITKVTLNKLSTIPVKVPAVSNDAKTYSQKAEQSAQQAQDTLEEVKKIQEELESSIDVIVNSTSPYDLSTIHNKNILTDKSSVDDIFGVYIYIDKEDLPGAIQLKEIKLQNRVSLGTFLTTECYLHLWELVDDTWIPLGTSSNNARQDLAAITTWEFADIKTRGGDLYISFHPTQDQNVSITSGEMFGCQYSNNTNTNTIIGTTAAPIPAIPDLTLCYNASYFTDYEHSQDADKHLTKELKEHLVLDNQEVTFTQTVSIKKQLIASTIVNEQGEKYATENWVEDTISTSKIGAGAITGYNDGVETSSIKGSTISITDHRGANALAQDFCKDKVNFDGSTLQIFANATNGSSLYKGYNIIKVYKGKGFIQSGGSFILDTKELVNGTKMFEGNRHLVLFDAPLQNLEDGTEMFKDNTSLEAFVMDMPSLLTGDRMFEGCFNLKQFVSYLGSITSAVDMFKGCKLTPESLLIILDTINKEVAGDLGEVGLDSSIPEEQYTSTAGVNSLQELSDLFASSGWTLTLKFN